MSYIAKTTAKGHDYFKIMESYRENGKAKHRVLLNIGTLQNLFALLPEYIQQGSLVPRPGAFAQIGDNNITIDPVRCRSHGSPYLLWSVAQWLGVEGIMAQCFKPGTDHSIQRSRSLLLGAIHRACKPGSKNEFEDWFRYTSLPDYLNLKPEVFTSQHFWEQMDEITVDDIKKFETTLLRKILAQFPEISKEMDCLSADFTNYFTYINTQNYRCEIAQLGHSKEGRTGQKIFSVAVVTTPLLGIPIATLVYPGNTNDKSALKLFLEELTKRLKDIVDLSNVTFVFDGGGTSEEALDMIPGHFISRGSMKSSAELYSVPLTEYQTFALDNGKQVRAYRTTSKQFGRQRTVVVSLSDDLQAGQVAELDKQINKLREGIHDLNQSLSNPRATRDKRLEAITGYVEQLMLPAFHFKDFISISYDTIQTTDPIILREFKKARKQYKATDKTPFTFEFNGKRIQNESDIPVVTVVKEVRLEVNEEKKSSMIDKYYGKHLLVTDHDDWTTDRILNVYRDQEFIERFFRDTKDTSHFSVRPAFHWTDQKLRVHVMMCYLGLTLCRVAQHLLKTKQNFVITSPELLDQLEKVQECIVMVNVNDEKLKPVRTISELESQESKTWEAVCTLIQYMKDNPAKAS